MTTIPIAGSSGIYCACLKVGEFDKEAPQIFRLERAAFVIDNGPSENGKYGVKPTPSKTQLSSGSSIYYDTGPGLRYETFCKKFISLIKAENFPEAKQLLAKYEPFIRFDISTQSFFDTEIPEIMEDSELAHRHAKVVEFAKIAEDQGFKTDATSAYRLGGLISLGKLEEAAGYLALNPNLKQAAEKLYKSYVLLERPFGPRKFLLKAAINFQPPEAKRMNLEVAHLKV